MGVGFAIISSQIKINGITGVKGQIWDVYFDNIQLSQGSVTPTTLEIVDKTSVHFSVALDDLKDEFSFKKVDCINNGTMNAMVDTLVKTELDNSVKDLVDYIITYEDGSEIVNGDILNVSDTVTYKIVFKYKDDTTISQ